LNRHGQTINVLPEQHGAHLRPIGENAFAAGHRCSAQSRLGENPPVCFVSAAGTLISFGVRISANFQRHQPGMDTKTRQVSFDIPQRSRIMDLLTSFLSGALFSLIVVSALIL